MDRKLNRITARRLPWQSSSGVLATCLVVIMISGPVRGDEAAIDPRSDGWQSEVIAETLLQKMTAFGQRLVGQKDATEERPLTTSFFTKDVHCHLPAWKPWADAGLGHGFQTNTSEVVFEDHHGPAAAAAWCASVANVWTSASDARAKFKLFRLTPTAAAIDVVYWVEFAGTVGGQSRQYTAEWECHWERIGGDGWQLSSLRSRNDQWATYEGPTPTLFHEATTEVIDGPVPAQLHFGIDHWRSRLESYLGIYFDGHHGVAVADVNGDGRDDVYVCEPGGLPNRLFLQSPKGFAIDQSATSGIDLLDYTRSALFADFDNDGDQDVCLAIPNMLVVFAGTGDGRFRLARKLATPRQTLYSLCAADIDRDGDLDVYGCGYHGEEIKENNRLPSPLPYHDARSGGKNRLFRNLGGLSFEESTSATGLGENNFRWSFAAAFADVDQDGDDDLYVANDFGPNHLYRNDAGVFTDVAAHTGAEDVNFGMSVAFGDFDRDAHEDIYVSNMFSAAGGRITFQPRFQPDADASMRRTYQQMARGNTLLRNRGDGTFDDCSVAAGVTMGRWAWASLFADIDNDGWQDLVIANGFVTGELKDDL